MARFDELRTASIGLRTWPWLKAEVDKIAYAQGMSTARYIERLLLADIDKRDKP